MIRLTSIELTNFKNVAYGRIALSPGGRGDYHGPDIIGIYGQNGSGKTSVVNAFDLFKVLALGEPLPEEALECIALGQDALGMEFEGLVYDGEKTVVCGFSYKAEIGAAASGSPVVAVEKLRVSYCDGNRNGSLKSYKTVFDYTRERDTSRTAILKPKGAWDALFAASRDALTDFLVASKFSFDAATSLLFAPECVDMLRELTNLKNQACGLNNKLSKGAIAALDEIVPLVDRVRNELHQFALCDLAVISPWRQAEPVLDLLRIAAHEDGSGRLDDRRFYMDLKRTPRLPLKEVRSLRHSIERVSQVLGSLVPGLSLNVRSLGPALLDDGAQGEYVEITATRGTATVPLRCESEGIKKLVSILGLLIDVYGNPGVCVVIDELDSGVFEFLLGEILAVLQKHGQGQLVFTAHNLRPLETLDKNSLVFTTTNPRRRYITFRGHKQTNNLRSQYLRAIDLGGQAETIYEPTSPYAIDDAFYEAAFEGGEAEVGHG